MIIAGRILRQLQRFDWVLILSVLALFAFGISAIYSVELSGDSADFIFVKKQLITFGLGVIALITMARSNYLLLRSHGRAIYIAGVMLMVLVLIFGRELNGTTGWFIVGPFSFQPVEFMKFAVALQLARYFGEHARRRFGWREILGSGFLTLLPVGLTMMQPDLGSAVLLIGIWVIMMFFAGIRWTHALVLLGATFLAILLAWSFVLADYQKQRVEVFLNPQIDPLESGYNVTQAKIAIGSGMLLGRGLGFGSQSQLKFLPESKTDFIFAVIAEELGFVGILLVLFAIAILYSRMLLLARRVKDQFATFLVIAIFGLFFSQITVNIGVNLSILPATGVALPFVSYGGTSLLVSLFLIGILESIAVRLRPGD
jgi:rod shape determining protein RodA